MNIKLPDFKIPQFKFPIKNPLASPFKIPFAHTQKLSLGLDIGSHAVKFCELAETVNGHTLLSLGSSLLPEGAVEDGVLQNSDAVAKVIAGLIKNLKTKGKKVAISISGYSVIVKKINLAAMSHDDLENHIHSEAEQYIPFDIDEVYLDFQNISPPVEGQERVDIMLVAAKKEVVDSYLTMLKSAGLMPVVVDVDAFALENAFEDNYGLEGNMVLVDIGASKMNINIISKGTSLLARDVAQGSRQLTEQIQSRFDLSFEEAENLKIGLTHSEERREALEDIFVSTCNQWIAEVKRALDFFYSHHPDEKINKLVISGGGARVKGLAEFFQQETDIPVEIFNPFSKVSFSPNSIDPEYVKYMAPEMAISFGLATRPVEL